MERMYVVKRIDQGVEDPCYINWNGSVVATRQNAERLCRADAETLAHRRVSHWAQLAIEEVSDGQLGDGTCYYEGRMSAEEIARHEKAARDYAGVLSEMHPFRARPAPSDMGAR